MRSEKRRLLLIQPRLVGRTFVSTTILPPQVYRKSTVLGGTLSLPVASLAMRYGNTSDEESETRSTSSILTDFAASMATSATSLDSGSMHSASRPPSVFSITSSLRMLAYRQEYGRNLNNYSEVYRLPADEEELERLGK